MGGGAWPFLVGGAICLVNSVNERDLSLLTSYAEARVIFEIFIVMGIDHCQLLVFNEEFLVSASHQLALTTSLPFVHTARRSYRLNGPVKCSDRGDVNLRKDHCRNLQKQTANTLQIKSGPGAGRTAPVRSPPPPAPRERARRAANEPPARHAPRKTERSVRRTVAPSAGCTGGGDVSRMSKRLSATDISALASMKNVAKCDTWCELQNPVNPSESLNARLRPKPFRPGHVCLGVTHRVAPPAPSRGGGHWPPVRTARGSAQMRSRGDARPRPVVVERSTRVLSCRARPSSARASRWTQRRQRLRPRPQVRRDHPLSLSISISGGKETYKDSPSNGERNREQPNLRIGRLRCPNCSLEKRPQRRTGPKSPGKGRRRG
ncbi:UNVERIFIED_CONTAM: hypothetical protein Sindi_2637800 [Sesamum indicum]